MMRGQSLWTAVLLGAAVTGAALAAQTTAPVTQTRGASIPMQGAGAGSNDAALPFPAAKTGGNYMHNFYFPPGLSATPWWPDWSPDGKWIAVSMAGSIWKVDFSEARKIYRQRAAEAGAASSSGGK